MVDVAKTNREAVNRAVERAWDTDRLSECVEITGTGLRNVQLHLTLADFD